MTRWIDRDRFKNADPDPDGGWEPKDWIIAVLVLVIIGLLGWLWQGL